MAVEQRKKPLSFSPDIVNAVDAVVQLQSKARELIISTSSFIKYQIKHLCLSDTDVMLCQMVLK